MTGDIAGAIRAYQAALAIDPKNARVQAMLAEARKKSP